MARRFRQHDIRRVTELTGLWDFAFLGDVDPDDVDASALDFTDVMAVPGCFDATPTYAGRRGLAAYRTRVLLADEGAYRLVFDGVQHWCRVFADGRPVKDHGGGFTRFAVDLPPRAPGEAEVVVLVDNRFDPARSPLHRSYYDWYHYGGIARGAELHRLGEAWVESIRVVTTELVPPRVRLEVDYRCRRGGLRAPLSVVVDGDVVLEETVLLDASGGRLARSIDLPGAALWSPAAPALHLLHVRLGDDDLRDRIGLRQVRTEGRRLLLNGRPLRLLGFNRHESHPAFGHGLPDALLVADVQIMRDLGCNFVRNAHYPADVRFLDLCDEMGLCVWTEPVAWQWKAEHLTDCRLVDAEVENLDEMVKAAANHPSVIMYGLLNESASDDPKCRPAYERLVGRFRETDPDRLVTYASSRPFEDICFDLADVISVNSYPGWYDGEVADITARLAAIADSVDSRGLADRPLLLSEVGAGAIPGWRDWNRGLWSEEYQADVLDAVLEYVLSAGDRWCGVALWQFCDCRSSADRSRALFRPRSYNNKGIVDEYRRPKLAYDIVRRRFRAANR